MKNTVRKSCLEKRKGLEKIDLKDKILAVPEYQKAETVFIYVSCRDEIKTHSLIKEALKTKRVLVPLCLNLKGDMIATEIHSFDELREGIFGILEPQNKIPYENEIDFALVPGAAFSLEGYRIGYGKGYYDKFLKDKQIFKMGVCHDELLLNTVPHDEFDVRLDMIITPEREIRI